MAGSDSEAIQADVFEADRFPESGEAVCHLEVDGWLTKNYDFIRGCLCHTWRRPAASHACVALETSPGCWTCPLTYRSETTTKKCHFFILILTWLLRDKQQTHNVIVGKSGGRFLDGGGSHALLFYSDSDWVPESSPHQLLQLLCLSGWKQACTSLLRQVAQDGV